MKDLPSREWKARKIERLLGLEAESRPLRLLEIGTGSGGIAAYFGGREGGRFKVEAVDVVDNRMVVEGYNFTLVEDTTLPFGDQAFDVVISNHVIEHVGSASHQLQHLEEVSRVLRSDGVAYLAVPNRWMLVEPHYRLPFLSWLPRRFRSPFLRLSGRGSFYDCEPLEMHSLEKLLDRAGLDFANLSVQALRATLDIERQGTVMKKFFDAVPDTPLKLLAPLIPTHIYAIRHGR